MGDGTRENSLLDSTDLLAEASSGVCDGTTDCNQWGDGRNSSRKQCMGIPQNLPRALE